MQQQENRFLWIGIIFASLAVLLAFGYFFFVREGLSPTPSPSTNTTPYVDPLESLSAEEIDALVESDLTADSSEESLILEDFSGDDDFSELEADFQVE